MLITFFYEKKFYKYILYFFFSTIFKVNKTIISNELKINLDN